MDKNLTSFDIPGYEWLSKLYDRLRPGEWAQIVALIREVKTLQETRRWLAEALDDIQGQLADRVANRAKYLQHLENTPDAGMTSINTTRSQLVAYQEAVQIVAQALKDHAFVEDVENGQA